MTDRRALNKRKFGNWEDLPSGGRRYWYDVEGRSGWRARYVKEVDNEEKTTHFRQEIYNEEGLMVAIHEKYPVDTGHRQVKE